MPTAARGDGPVDTVMITECLLGCGVILGTPVYDVPNVITRHFVDRHPDIEHAKQDEHFSVYEAPLRCDTCSTFLTEGRPAWQHICTPPLNQPPIIDRSGIWLLCGHCHDYALAQDLAAMVARNLNVVRRQSPGVAAMEEVMADAERVVGQRFAALLPRLDVGIRFEV